MARANSHLDKKRRHKENKERLKERSKKRRELWKEFLSGDYSAMVAKVTKGESIPLLRNLINLYSGPQLEKSCAVKGVVL